MKRTAKEMSVSHSGKRSLQLVVCNMGDGVTEEKGRERGERRACLSLGNHGVMSMRSCLIFFFFFFWLLFFIVVIAFGS